MTGGAFFYNAFFGKRSAVFLQKNNYQPEQMGPLSLNLLLAHRHRSLSTRQVGLIGWIAQGRVHQLPPGPFDEKTWVGLNRIGIDSEIAEKGVFEKFLKKLHWSRTVTQITSFGTDRTHEQKRPFSKGAVFSHVLWCGFGICNWSFLVITILEGEMQLF